MKVQPFDLAACPRVAARDARALRAALRTCALIPARWSLALPPFGVATMSFAGFDAATNLADDGGVELAVAFGADLGRVAVEAAFASRLVDTFLGGEPVFSAARAPGPAERGVLVGVLGPIFDRIGGSLQLAPLAGRERRGGDAAPLAFALQTAVASGRLRLSPPSGGLPARDDVVEAWRARAARVPTIGHLEIARTGVTAGALAMLAPGDAVVFDGARAGSFERDSTWTAWLRVGEHVAEVAVDGGGQLSMVGGFSQLQHEEGNMSISGSDTDGTTVIARASIEVVAELGRIALRGEEVMGLVPGAVLALGARRTGVSLRVGGEVWAEGEIVDVDGELGVRVTRVANR